MAAKKSADDMKIHITDTQEFFSISGFFIAYVVIYAISVPLVMHYINKSWKVLGGLA